jgi:molybdopterin molybdotransferase
MIRHAEALALLRAAARDRRLPIEDVSLKNALGRICAEPLKSRDPIPPFDNSAMDGFALASARAAKAPARIPVLGAIMAGDAPRCRAESGAWRIMTGAPMPAGCDAVIPVERTRSLDGGRAVETLDPVEAGDYVRGRGRDFAAGAEVCPAGARLGARHLLALAAVGAAKIPVRRRPRVALISTGRELAGPEETDLEPGQIRDASSTYLSAAVPELGADFEFHGIVPDVPHEFRSLFENALSRNVDVVLTTGAVSMGDADFIPSSLKDLGAEIVFHKVAIRPGKPVLFAQLKDGPVIFGLPGNPISTVVGLRFFVEPYLRSVLGRPDESPFRSKLSADAEKPDGLRGFFKARRSPDGSVEILPGQASFQIHSLLAADCWAVLPEEGAVLKAGTEIDAFPLAEALS